MAGMTLDPVWVKYCKKARLDPRPRKLRKDSRLWQEMLDACPECGRVTRPYDAEVWGNTVRAFYKCAGCLWPWTCYFDRRRLG